MRLANTYGHFTDDGREYVITRPDTPYPWINVLTNGDYGLTLSQAGSGYSWLTHASLNRITRWEQDLIRDEAGKFLYVRDSATGEFWSPTWQPCGSCLQDYTVRHGLGYSIISGQCNGIATTVTYFVPVADPSELWLLKIANRSQTARRLQVFSYLEWLLGAAPDWHREFHSVFIETRFSAEHGALLARKVLWDLPGQSGPHWNRDWPYVAFHSVSPRPAGFEGYKLAFLGRHGRPGDPQAVRTGRLQGTSGRWGDAIASLQVEVEVGPGAETELVFALGAAHDEARALDVVQKYRSVEAAQEALAETRRFWQGITAGLTLETPDEALNVMGNTWLKYQAIAGRMFGRTAYYQTGGAYGFRDQLQDSLTWLLLGQPERTLAQIRLHAAHQYRDGIVLHWWHPLAESGLRSNYSDDLLWLPYVVHRYIEETGDFTCLDEEIAFFDDGSASLLAHCLAAFDVALDRLSPRGLPLILEGDWNDGLNAVGAGRRGESIWMAHFLYALLTAWAGLPPLDEAVRARFRREADALAGATNAHGWDGAWYWRASTDEGAPIGSAENREGRIFLNAQTWSVLSGLAPRERAVTAMASAREHLYQPYGALLFAPAFSVPDPAVGYLTRYAPGVRENGGVYVHAACWAVLAERKLGDAHGERAVDRAYRLWSSFNPARRGEEPDVYMGEPYVMPGNVEGPDSEHAGRGAWTWYTGSSGWYLRALVEGVLGVEARLDGLHVARDLPAGWDGYRIVRPFRGARYDIRVRRGMAGEAPGCTVNGEPCAREALPILPGAVDVQIIVP